MSFLEPEVGPSTLQRIMLALEIAVAAVLARWRAIILAVILFVTIWFAVQAFLLAREAFSYAHDGLSRLSERIKELPSIQAAPTGSATISPPITKCWRNRSLAGDCFKLGQDGPQSPPVRSRVPAPRRPSRFHFCGCGPVDI